MVQNKRCFTVALISFPLSGLKLFFYRSEISQRVLASLLQSLRLVEPRETLGVFLLLHV